MNPFWIGLFIGMTLGPIVLIVMLGVWALCWSRGRVGS
jgi:hypothetical protein